MMRKVSAEEIKDNIIRYGLPEDATDDVKEVAKQMEKEEVNRIYKNVTQCHPRCPSITRFRQIWPTYNDLIQLRPQCGRNCLSDFLNLFLTKGRLSVERHLS